MRFALLFVLLAGWAVMAEARPRTLPDRITAWDAATGHLQLQTTGAAVLAGIALPRPALAQSLLERIGPEVEIKSWGTDRYGRARVLVFAPKAAQPVQVDLLRAGAALAYDDRAIQAAWRNAETEARRARRGLWATPPLPADAVPDSPGRFVLLQGTVTSVYAARHAYYVNFGDDWKTDFSVSIPKRAWRAFGGQPAIVPGTAWRMRGALIHENGPMLVVTRPEQMEPLDADPR